ncbi:hypothetical protein Nmel_009905 [Mimus melanotis]
MGLIAVFSLEQDTLVSLIIRRITGFFCLKAHNRSSFYNRSPLIRNKNIFMEILCLCLLTCLLPVPSLDLKTKLSKKKTKQKTPKQTKKSKKKTSKPKAKLFLQLSDNEAEKTSVLLVAEISHLLILSFLWEYRCTEVASCDQDSEALTGKEFQAASTSRDTTTSPAFWELPGAHLSDCSLSVCAGDNISCSL